MEWSNARPLVFYLLTLMAGIALAIVHQMRKRESGQEKRRLQKISSFLLIFSLFSFVILYYFNMFWKLDLVFFVISVVYYTIAILEFELADDWRRALVMLTVPLASTIYIGIPNIWSIFVAIAVIIYDIERTKKTKN